MILAGDTGGTKTLLALFDGGELRRHEVFHAADHHSVEELLDLFVKGETIEAACFGVAGPVVDGTAKITNLPWTIAASSLSARLRGVPVRLINDLQATALGVLALPDSAFEVLQTPAAPPAKGATIGVIAPGTGLGEAVLAHDGKRYRPLPSEAGHADLAPSTDEEIELLKFLRARHGGHVSWERVLCGDGIGALYDFARTRLGTLEPAWELADRNAAISGAALAGTDPAAVRALELFAALLGAEAGNLALRAMAAGGIAIGGGIPPKVLPALRRGALLERFTAKGRFAPWLKTVGLRVVLEPRAALFGAAREAATLIEDHP